MAIDVEIVLQKADVGAVLHKLGIDWEKRASKRGHELYFACPTNHHQDDPNNKRISVADSGKFKGHFNCWACDFKGNLIHLIRFMRNCKFKAALDFLQKDYGSAEVAGLDALKFRLRMAKPAIESKAGLPEFELPDDYLPIMQDHSQAAYDARQWLSGERHISQDAMFKFQIGFSQSGQLPDTKGPLGPSVVVPVMFQGKMRSVFMAQPFQGGLKRYPKNSPQGEILFNYDACLSAKRYIMVESILDVIKGWSVTSRDFMACFTNMISDEQRDLLRPFEEHGVMPDLDGKRGWDLVDRMVPYTGKGLWLYFPPIGKDPGDCTRKELNSAIQWRQKYCDYESKQRLVVAQKVTPKIKRVEKL